MLVLCDGFVSHSLCSFIQAEIMAFFCQMDKLNAKSGVGDAQAKLKDVKEDKVR